MWFERFVIIVTSLHRDFLPSSWNYFTPTWVDIGIYVGTLGIFFTLFLLFARTFPVIAIAEVKAIFRSSSEVSRSEMSAPLDFSDVHHADDHGHAAGGAHAAVQHNKNFNEQ
jgi:molybdopterin-containing oxidoreductase family membrane subunit